MTTLIEDAVRALRKMPEAAQAAAARAILDYGATVDNDAYLTDEQVAEIERRMADPNRTFITLDETRMRLRSSGLL